VVGLHYASYKVMNMYERKHKQVVKDCHDPKIRVSPLVAIRANCLECMGFHSAEVTRCEIKDCALWKFRTGRNLSGKRGVSSKSKLSNSARASLGIAQKKS